MTAPSLTLDHARSFEVPSHEGRRWAGIGADGKPTHPPSPQAALDAAFATPQIGAPV